MRTSSRYSLPLAGVLAITASGCASMRQTSASNPAASRVETSQKQSKEALASAAEAQERASDQQKRAARAQDEVREAQRRLAEAQKRAEEETAKAEQAQQQANQATQQATQQAQQAQQQASQGLEQQQQLVRRGEQVLSGQVQRASPSQLVVQPQGGDEMTFQITDRTQVQIDGRQASAAEIIQGGDARVAYEMAGTQPTATLVQVVTGAAPGAAPTPPASEMGTGTGGTGSTGTGGTSGTSTPPERTR